MWVGEGGNRWTMPAKRARDMSSHDEALERVELYLGGVRENASESVLASFLRSIARVGGTAFSGEVAVELRGRWARATLAGIQAGVAARVALGKRLEMGRPLEEVALHNDWYCPCRKSGKRPMPQEGRCASCGQPRPPALLDALAHTAVCQALASSSDGFQRTARSVTPPLPLAATVVPPSGLQERLPAPRAVDGLRVPLSDATERVQRVPPGPALAPSREKPATQEPAHGLQAMGEQLEAMGATLRAGQQGDVPEEARTEVLGATLTRQHEAAGPREWLLEEGASSDAREMQSAALVNQPTVRRWERCPDDAWDEAAKRGALTWRDPRLTIYRKQNACLAVCEQNGALSFSYSPT